MTERIPVSKALLDYIDAASETSTYLFKKIDWLELRVANLEKALAEMKK
jgi:hypothetical protein